MNFGSRSQFEIDVALVFQLLSGLRAKALSYWCFVRKWAGERKCCGRGICGDYVRKSTGIRSPTPPPSSTRRLLLSFWDVSSVEV